MKVESNWTKTRYSFICEDEKDKEFLDKMNKYIDELEEENKKLREEWVRLLKENSELEKKVKEQYYEIQQYEEWFANGSWHWDDEY